MNQGGTTDTITTLDTNSLEKYQVVDPSQAHSSSYYAPSSSAPLSWSTHGVNNYPRENGIVSNSVYYHDQQAELMSRSVQDGSNVTPVASTSTSGAAHVPQDYSSYAAYQNTDPSGYGNTGYAAYYSGYQQQTNQSYQPPVGAYQNSGAPYQPLTSFQNTGSYAGSASYSSTYYNPADYQTSGGYQSGVYSNQNNYWQQGQYATYSSNQYPSYTPDSTAVYSSTSGAASSQYEQHYKQWADYYNQSQTEVSCAPGTENVSVSGASSLNCPVPAVTGGYPASNSPAPAPYIPSWRPQSTSSELPLSQPGTANGSVHDGYWKSGSAVFQNQSSNSMQQHHVQTPLDISSTRESFQNQQTSTYPQGQTSIYTTHQVSQSFQSSMQTVSQTAPQIDSRKVSSKVQIPTNPRIASNLAFGLSKVDQDSFASSVSSKPAYISVSMTKPNDKVPSDDAAADSILKPGMFPKSLCGYVERALVRCKGDAQMAASQAVMKEIITKATADGTLHTRDWDTEPLFVLPNADTANQGDVLFSTTTSSLPKKRKSPSRRSKSRWEPVSEEKLADKPVAAAREPVKFGVWNKQFTGGKLENKADNWSNTKFSLPDHKSPNKKAPRPAKKQRLLDADNGNASSESDKEQSLTAYYSAAIALTDSPEERKRRESRSKRFEKGHGNRAENNHFRPKNAGAGNLSNRRASIQMLSRNFEDSGSKAVEDIDWDALTVKGTCQEIEKRYLRLTSAPEPATVRPEEVLQKALLMVQSSEKNYLYKCDQLKSIRQDLTVQRICNELTVKVYETHARLAIEVGDLPEYNQCQSQLKTLYAEGIRGCHLEFAAYNLLCVILHSNNNRDLLSALSRLPAEARKSDAVKHALAVRAAVTSGNYVLFFRLYKTAPNLNTLLMDLYVEKMRYAAVKCMSRSYRPIVPVAYISQVLGFASALPTTESSDEKETDGVEECAEWLKAHGACLTKDNSGEMLLDTKVSMSNLYMPEPEDAVSHGDANLAVDDFLSRNPL